MAAAKPARIRIYCDDPFAKHKKKVLKDKAFLELEESYVFERSTTVPQLLERWKEGERFICKLCVWKVKMQHDKLRPPELELQSLSLLDESLSDHESDPTFVNVATDKSNFIRELEKLGIEVEGLSKRYVSKDVAIGIRRELQANYEKLLQSLEQVTGISFSEEKDNNVNEECKSCYELTKQLIVRFHQVTAKDDQYKILTCVPQGVTIAQVTEKFECTQHMARKASKLKRELGAFCCPPPKVGRKLDPATVAVVKDFYLSDVNSRVDPSIRGTVLIYDEDVKARVPIAKRLILTTLSDLYTEFTNLFPDHSISISRFALERPKWCIFSGNKAQHYSCTCILHENFSLLLSALKIKADVSDFIASVVCSEGSDECSLGTCPICPNTATVERCIQNYPYPSLTYHYWGTMEGTYGVGIHEKTEPLIQFESRFMNLVSEIVTHHFLMKKQMEFVDHMKKDILPNENSALLQVDFAQNYSYVVQGAVQGYHWNNDQATVHPFVLTWYDKEARALVSKSYIVISDHNDHDAMSFHAFRSAVIKQIKADGFSFSKLYYLSDGAGSQYKNKCNFLNLIYHKKDFNIDAEWHFHAASHGKSQCDAMGAIIKRVCRLASLNVDPTTKERVFITNVHEMGRVAALKLNSDKLRVMIVTSTEVESLSKSLKEQGRFSNIKTIAGTRLYHSVRPCSQSELIFKRYSLSHHQQVKKIFKKSKSLWAYKVDQFVGVKIEGEATVGLVTRNSKEFGYEISLMRRYKRGNSFVWPDTENTKNFLPEEIFAAVERPTGNKTDRVFKLSAKDYQLLSNK